MNENDSFDMQNAQQPQQPQEPQEPAAEASDEHTAAPRQPDEPHIPYSYVPQQPQSYRPAAAPRPQTNPYAVQGAYIPQPVQQAAPVPPRPVYTPPVNPAAQGAYVPPRPVYTPPVNPMPAPARNVRPKREKKTSGVRIAVIALCCALVGSILGGGIVGVTMRSVYNKTEASAPKANETQPKVEAAPANPTVTAPANTSGTSSAAQIYQSNVPAIVGIANESTSTNIFGQTSKSASSGTGFVISPDGEILTNFHVVAGAQTLTVSMYDGTSYNAIVLGYEAESDIALLKIEAENLPTVKLGNSDTLHVGDAVAAIGNPLGELTYTMTTGIVSSMDRDVNADGTPINMMQIDAAINPGNSGGPLFDQNGAVVGITTAKYSGTTGSGTTIEGIGFAIPINDVLSILDDLRENGSVPNRAYIGISVESAAASQAMQTPAGARVVSVTEGSSGAEAGLQEGDIITALDDVKIESMQDLSKALKKFRAGDSAELTVFRSGSSITLTIRFDTKQTSGAPEIEETEETQPAFDPWSFFLP